MPVELTIVESVTELESASAPGPQGPQGATGAQGIQGIQGIQGVQGDPGEGVPTGGSTGEVLAKASNADFDTEWSAAAGGGAPTDVDYLVGTASGSLSAEIVVGATPGGELGGTWASPTVDTTHSGSSHADVQAAAEATAATALSGHVTDTTDAHDASAISVDSTALSGTATDVQASLEELDNLLDDHSTRHENGGADEISLAGLSGTSEALQAHLDDTADAHDASAISILDTADDFTATDVEGALAELQGDHESDAQALSDHISDSSAAHAASAISADSTTLVGTGTDVQAVLEELDNGIADHLADTSAAHAASAISADSTTLVGTGTDVQAVLEELDNGIADHLADTSDAHDASAISFTPNGSIAATDVQAAIQEVRDEAGGSSTAADDENLVLHMQTFA